MHFRRRIPQHELDSLVRVVRIDRNICRASFQHRKNSDEHPIRPTYKDRDEILRTDTPAFNQIVCEAISLGIEFAIRQRPPVDPCGYSVRAQADPFLE